MENIELSWVGRTLAVRTIMEGFMMREVAPWPMIWARIVLFISK
jgi:hypothetical protein